jgi:hypothetical protein
MAINWGILDTSRIQQKAPDIIGSMAQGMKLGQSIGQLAAMPRLRGAVQSEARTLQGGGESIGALAQLDPTAAFDALTAQRNFEARSTDENTLGVASPLIREHNTKAYQMAGLLDDYRTSKDETKLAEAKTLAEEIGVLKAQIAEFKVPNIGEYLTNTGDVFSQLGRFRAEERKDVGLGLQKSAAERQEASEKARREEWAKNYGVQLQNLALANERTGLDKTRLTAELENKIGDDYSSNPVIVAYNTAKGFSATAQALYDEYEKGGSKNASSLDGSLVAAYAKSILPNEAVMEGDIRRVMGQRPIFERVVGMVKGGQKGGFFANDEERKDFVAAIKAIESAAADRAKEAAFVYKEQAKRYGVTLNKAAIGGTSQPSGVSNFE